MTFKDLVAGFMGYVNTLAVIFITIIVVVFIYKMVAVISAADSGDGRQKLKQLSIYGVIIIFFAVSFIAIARMIGDSIGI